MVSPYEGIPVSQWQNSTEELVRKHPLDINEIVNVVIDAWAKIMRTKIGGELQIGVDVFPSPQIMGSYLHEIIPALLSRKHPDIWRREQTKYDKDVEYIPDTNYAIEIKTSSQNKIFGNRSYGQDNSDNNSGKLKYGYYLAINFEKFTPTNHHPKIKKIKFGWLDHTDWKAQAAATGQNSTLSNDAWNYKLKELYPN